MSEENKRSEAQTENQNIILYSQLCDLKRKSDQYRLTIILYRLTIKAAHAKNLPFQKSVLQF